MTSGAEAETGYPELADPVPLNPPVEEVIDNGERREVSNVSSSSASSDRDGSGEDISWINVEATYYTAFCDTGCIGITRTGVDVSETIYYEGRRIIAVDPSVIPLGSVVHVKTDNGESFEATAQDTGGAIVGNKIDILVGDHDEAMRLGRVEAKVRVID